MTCHLYALTKTFQIIISNTAHGSTQTLHSSTHILKSLVRVHFSKSTWQTTKWWLHLSSKCFSMLQSYPRTRISSMLPRTMWKNLNEICRKKWRRQKIGSSTRTVSLPSTLRIMSRIAASSALTQSTQKTRKNRSNWMQRSVATLIYSTKIASIISCRSRLCWQKIVGAIIEMQNKSKKSTTKLNSSSKIRRVEDATLTGYLKHRPFWKIKMKTELAVPQTWVRLKISAWLWHLSRPGTVSDIESSWQLRRGLREWRWKATSGDQKSKAWPNVAYRPQLRHCLSTIT